METKRRQSHSAAPLALVLLAVFALCLMSLLLTAGEVYAGLVREGQSHHAQRTAGNYLATRLKQSDGVTVADFEGVTALVFPEEAAGSTYITRVYCYDGWLRELYTTEKCSFSPGDGEKLLEMEALSVIMEEGYLYIHYTLPGESPRQLLWQIREGRL